MKRLIAWATFLVIAWTPTIAAAQGLRGGHPSANAAPALVTSQGRGVSPPLRTMSPKAAEQLSGVEVPRHKLPLHRGPAAPAPPEDIVVQDTFGAPGVPSTIGTFEGVGNVDGVLPPDANGDVGPSHYVQTVNLSFAIFGRQRI